MPMSWTACPKPSQAKRDLQAIWMALIKEQANQAFDYFVALFHAKYPKAVECLTKDRESLLAFYDFPVEHWVHLRTSNPIESTFATVRHRSNQTRRAVSRETALPLAFKLVKVTKAHWRKLTTARGFFMKASGNDWPRTRVSKADEARDRGGRRSLSARVSWPDTRGAPCPATTSPPLARAPGLCPAAAMTSSRPLQFAPH